MQYLNAPTVDFDFNALIGWPVYRDKTQYLKALLSAL